MLNEQEAARVVIPLQPLLINVVLDAFTQFLDIIGGIDFSLSILSFSKKHITLQPHLVLPLMDNTMRLRS